MSSTIQSRTLAGRSLHLRLGWLVKLRHFFVDHLWLFLFPLVIPALLPFYTEGLPRSFDGGLHLLRISLLDRYMRQGMLFPRWMPELLLGHGYPLLNYYAPGSYYLVEALHWAGLDLYTAFIVTLVAFVIGGGLGMYFLARDIFGRQQPGAVLVAALAYLYGPYLLTNVFIRGAIAEAGAQALLPWIFWSVRRLLTNERPARYLLPVVFSLGGLALMHNITLLFAPPVLLVYIALHWWLGGRRRVTLVWMAVALLGAMGISAFFWLPALLERPYLGDTVIDMLKRVWLAGNVWKWENFLDRSWIFNYSFARPQRLGLMQLVLGIGGFVLARRFTGEWLYWGLVALAAGVMMSAWSLPLWLASDILSIAQFTWRLLSILSLPLALFAAGLLVRLRPGWPQVLVTPALLALIVWAHTPRLGWIDVFDAATVDLSLPVFLQVEVDKDIIEGGTANPSIQEFRPRWAAETLELQPLPAITSPALIEEIQANSFGLQATVTTTTTTPLIFNDYYFPGWRILLDGAQSLQPYPSTNLGLLTVDLPPGRHTVQATWVGTDVQRWSGWLSLLTLGVLVLIVIRQPGWRVAAVAPVVCLVFGLVATVQRPALTELAPPAQAIDKAGLKLLGYRWERQADAIYFYPYWQVATPPPPGLRARWQLQASSGRVLVDVTTSPYFNAYGAANFPAGALVDDAYRIPLPPGLPADEYWVALTVGASRNELLQKPVIVGQVQIGEPVPQQAAPRQAAQMQVSNQARLIGFDLNGARRPLLATHEQPAVVKAGAYLRYRLHWQALRTPTQNYHAFVHLVDSRSQPLAQQDQLPGPFFRPPLLWDPYRSVTDGYLLRVPVDAPSGLYWPAVGMYNFTTLERLPLFIEGEEEVRYEYRLPPVKVLNPPTQEPTQRLNLQMGNLGNLWGYDLSLSTLQVRAGESFAVTLYYRANGADKGNYTRFLHLYDAGQGMAAQQDGPPQGGVNPTSAWLPGEVIADRVELLIPAGVAPGDYTLYAGFYDSTNGTRLPLVDGGQPLPDNRAVLTTITVIP